MNRFITKNCFYVDPNSVECLTGYGIQNVRQAILSSSLRPRIQQALERINFRFHRTCSSAIIAESNAAETETLLMYWGDEDSDSRAAMSLSASSCSSVQQVPPNHRDKELRSTSQQTDIICRIISGLASPANEAEERALRARIADSVTFSSPASSIVHPSMSLIGSVCALLLNKPVCESDGSVTPKEVSSVTGSLRSDICRICFGGESAERLVRPCGCRGTIAAVHRACLERWLLQAATSYCELCRHHYDVTRTHKWSWLRSLVQWGVRGGGRALAADAWRGAALGAVSVLGTARALHACDAVLQAGAARGGSAALAANLFSSLLIGVIGALNGLLTTWMLLKVQEHQASWRAWRESALHVHVSLSPSPRPSPQPSVRTLVGTRSSTRDRSTNVADPFMVTAPNALPDS